MKTRKYIITLLVILVIAVAITLRLIANKRAFQQELNAVSEFTAVVPVKVDTVSERPVSSGFGVTGTFEALSTVSVVSETQGRIVATKAGIGQKVTAGQVLAEIEHKLQEIKLQTAKSNFEKAKKDESRFEVLAQNDAATTQQYEAARLARMNAESGYVAARKAYDDSFIRAPISGVITKREIDEGDYLMPAMPAFTIVRTDPMKFIVNLTAGEVSRISNGEEVGIRAEQFPGVEFRGKVHSVSIQADPSRRYRVEVLVPNNSNDIMPGMYGSAVFGMNYSVKNLVIPRSALTGSIKSPQTFVVTGDSVVLRTITAIPVNDRYLKVDSGLHPGDVIVTAGQINLVSGSKIRINP